MGVCAIHSATLLLSLISRWLLSAQTCRKKVRQIFGVCRWFSFRRRRDMGWIQPCIKLDFFCERNVERRHGVMREVTRHNCDAPPPQNPKRRVQHDIITSERLTTYHSEWTSHKQHTVHSENNTVAQESHKTPPTKTTHQTTFLQESCGSNLLLLVAPQLAHSLTHSNTTEKQTPTQTI